VNRVLLTGATGFVGSAVLERLVGHPDLELVLAGRRRPVVHESEAVFFPVAGLDADTHWGEALQGIDVVIHTAARVHVMKDAAEDPLAEYRRVNVEGSLALARQAASAGVRRFIFLSSIKVNGERSDPGHSFTAEDQPGPVDPYGRSKWETEQALHALGQETGLEIVVIRPPLVYGPGVRANFLMMMCWLHRRVPLPLGAVENQRSLVARDNLVDLIATCIDHPAAANEVFLVSDGEDVTTTELLRRLGEAMGKPARLIPVPIPLLKGAALVMGKQPVANRLLGSLQMDIEKTRVRLNWEPPVSVDEGLRKTADHFRVAGQC